MKILPWRQSSSSVSSKVSYETNRENDADTILTNRLKSRVKKVLSPLLPFLFDELDFREGFFKTCDEEGPDRAVAYLIKNAPGMLRSPLNRQEKLNHLLYMSRMIQNSGTAKYGIAKVARKSSRMWRIWKRWGATEPSTFVDFGCGGHDPIALSTIMYGAGFQRALANDQRVARSPTYSALSLLEILAFLRLRPDKYIPDDIDANRFLERLTGFDLDALTEGNFDDGIAPMQGLIDYSVCDIVDADIAEREASLIVSYAVFEHVMDVPEVLRFLHSRTEPGGVGFHYIDLRDHRAYRGTGEYNEFSFLCEDTGPVNLNRLRRSELTSAFTAAGFDILHVDSARQPFSEKMRPNLTPRFAWLAQDDLETVAVTLTVRRPA
jgi:hypothetical protein